MSQHHLSVITQQGATVKLVAGFDPRLREFFLSLRDVRLSEPDETPELLSEQAQAERDAEQADFVNYDSLSEAQPMRHISHVEGLLQEHEIAFGDEQDNPEQDNPQLLPLLMVLLKEQQSGGAEVGRTLRDWDAEADAEAEAEADAEAERGFIRAEQYAEWAEEAKANREAEEDNEDEAEEEDNEDEAEEAKTPVETQPRGWASLKVRLTSWWAARH